MTNHIEELMKAAGVSKYRHFRQYNYAQVPHGEKELQNQMVYKKCSYDPDKNAYTKLVDNTINELTKQWKADFDKYIKEEVMKEAYDYAIQKIAKAFNVREKELKDV